MVCKSWDTSSVKAGELFPHGCLKHHGDFAKGIFRSQKSKGRVRHMHTHKNNHVQPGQLTSEINISSQHHSAGGCCYDLLPVCWEEKRGRHFGIRDSAPVTLPAPGAHAHTSKPHITSPSTEILPEQRAQDVCGQGLI